MTLRFSTNHENGGAPCDMLVTEPCCGMEVDLVWSRSRRINPRTSLIRTLFGNTNCGLCRKADEHGREIQLFQRPPQHGSPEGGGPRGFSREDFRERIFESSYEVSGSSAHHRQPKLSARVLAPSRPHGAAVCGCPSPANSFLHLFVFCSHYLPDLCLLSTARNGFSSCEQQATRRTFASSSPGELCVKFLLVACCSQEGNVRLKGVDCLCSQRPTARNVAHGRQIRCTLSTQGQLPKGKSTSWIVGN